MTLGSFTLNNERLWHYRATVTRVIDGDTVDVVPDVGFGIHLWALVEDPGGRKRYPKRLRLRLLGIDAPEMRGTERPLGLVSKAALRERVEGNEVIIQTHSQDKYGRWVATLYLPTPDGELEDVNAWMVASGHATPFV